LKKPFKIGLTITGTIIGAGFATGKELLVFFNGSSFFFTALMISAVILTGISSLIYFHNLKETKTNRILNIIFLAFSAGCYVIMLACGGQAIYDSLNLSYNSGVIITFILTIIIIKFGIEGIYRFNLFAAPIIVISLIFISFAGLSAPVFSNASTPVVNSFLYSGYNILAVLPIISVIAKDSGKKEGFWGIIIGFFIVLITSISIKLLLNGYYSLISEEGIPIFKIVSILNPYFSYIYSMVLYTAIMTTAASLLYVLTKGKSMKAILMISIPLLIVSFLGFTTLLEKIYTYFGYIGIIIILLINGDGIRRISHGK